MKSKFYKAVVNGTVIAEGNRVAMHKIAKRLGGHVWVSLTLKVGDRVKTKPLRKPGANRNG